MTNGDRNLRLAAFILNIISMVALGWTLLPLAWMSPMTVMSWGIYKGTRANTVAFGVCNLLFMNGRILVVVATPGVFGVVVLVF